MRSMPKRSTYDRTAVFNTIGFVVIVIPAEQRHAVRVVGTRDFRRNNSCVSEQVRSPDMDQGLDYSLHIKGTVKLVLLRGSI